MCGTLYGLLAINEVVTSKPFSVVHFYCSCEIRVYLQPPPPPPPHTHTHTHHTPTHIPPHQKTKTKQNKNKKRSHNHTTNNMKIHFHNHLKMFSLYIQVELYYHSTVKYNVALKRTHKRYMSYFEVTKYTPYGHSQYCILVNYTSNNRNTLYSILNVCITHIVYWNDMTCALRGHILLFTRLFV